MKPSSSEDRKLTLKQAASLIGCDYKCYQSLESGSEDVRLSMLERMFKAFELPVTRLLEPHRWY